MEFKKRNFNNDDENRSDRDNNRDENRDNIREDNREGREDNRGGFNRENRDNRDNREGRDNYNRERNFSGDRENRDGNAFRERFTGNRENRDGGGNRENRDGGGGFRERSFGGGNRENQDGGGGFRERSFGGGNRENRDGGGGFNRGGDNRGGGDRGGFRREFNRDERPPRPQHELVQSAKFRAGKRRTYFFDVRKTENGDHYMTLTESTQKINGGYDRNKVFLYKEDFNRFVRELGTMVDLIKNDLQPDYDYDEFERRQLEWEEQRRLEIENGEHEPREQRSNNNNNQEEGAEIAERRVFSFSKSKMEDDMMEDRPVEKKEAPATVKGTDGQSTEGFEDQSGSPIDDDMAW